MSANSNLVALVTGANRGLGLETSRQLASKGVTVIMGGRNQATIEKQAAALTSEGLSVLPVVLDVTNSDQIEAVRQKIEGEFGRLDILINNAGIVYKEALGENTATTISQEALRKTFDVNFFAQVAITQTLLPLLKKAPAARIVNLSSILGSLTVNRDFDGDFGQVKPVAYISSKVALNMFTVALAAALKDTKIKVNSAHPGWVKTDMGGEGAPMELSDGVKTSVALALLGDDGPTGQFIHLGEQVPW